ncbi:helix-turn-helix domain-containing protein [Zhouia sp. PK063]|uniref:helix-turn-helix domain-containing protein n=1 Tax=Zhouia sp. PK063 TaxID=3373602 RepID=UPI0037A10D0B
MKQLRQYTPLVIETLRTDVFEFPKHGQNYYELIYILEGTGLSHINEIKLPYTTGTLCFVSPTDHHYFDISTKTTFVFIKFTEGYWQSSFIAPVVVNRLLHLFTHPHLKEIPIAWTYHEQQQLRQGFEHLLLHKDQPSPTSTAIICAQLLLLLTIIEAHTHHFIPTSLSDKTMAPKEVLSYIHQHIYRPEVLKIDSIAAEFHIASQYFSAWFKQQYHTSYKTYINQYRIGLLKNRLRYTTISFQNIAIEFGFSDSSHFSNYFFKHTQVRPSYYRNQYSKM